MCLFPNRRYDDEVDSTAQAIAWTKMRPLNTGMLDYYRMLAENRRAGADSGCSMVRILAPEGIGSVQTWSGRHLKAG